MYSMKRISSPCRRPHLVLGHAADADGVDLHRLEAGCLRGEDALDHLVDAVAPRQLPEALRVERVEADIDAPQSRLVQLARLGRQQQAVRGQADVLDAWHGADHLDQPRQAAAQQRLAAGQTDLVDAQGRYDFDEAGDLLER
jgi:hypothetical protein